VDDPTEDFRREAATVINTAAAMAAKLAGPDELRQALAETYGQVWDTRELSRDFDVIGFSAPFVVVRRKADGKKGSLGFCHQPRFYYAFREIE